MEMNQTLWICLYYGSLVLLCSYGVHRYWMLYLYHKHKADRPPEPKRFGSLPRVTIQLPLYNELYVVERLLRAVTRLDYPRPLLDIQVLDDSTDETRAVSERLVAEYRAQGFDIAHVTRGNRDGYKAGALAHGLRTARGEFVAIFDADFLPEPDLLRRLIHHFTDPGIGMVQSRWGHINEDYSLLTRIQSVLLDGHFLIEQTARCRAGRFFNFNGTAGIWRRECIEDAGGWEGDTLAEDLDLSYRAQLAGWRFLYLPEVVTPAELPIEMNGFKNQQHRWAKGSVQACKKLLPALWRSDQSLAIKLEGTVHLTANLAYLPLLFVCFLLNPHFCRGFKPGLAWMLAVDIPIFLAASVSIVLFYICAQRDLHRDWLRRLWLLPLLMAVGIGLSLNNARAVLEALCNHHSAFARTPKYGVGHADVRCRARRYRALKQWMPWVEMACAVCISYFILVNFSFGRWAMVPFLMLFLFGFLYVSAMSLLQQMGVRLARPSSPAELAAARA